MAARSLVLACLLAWLAPGAPARATHCEYPVPSPPAKSSGEVASPQAGGWQARAGAPSGRFYAGAGSSTGYLFADGGSGEVRAYGRAPVSPPLLPDRFLVALEASPDEVGADSCLSNH